MFTACIGKNIDFSDHFLHLVVLVMSDIIMAGADTECGLPLFCHFSAPAI